MEDVMRLKEAATVVEAPAVQLHVHNNAVQRDRNRNRPTADKLPEAPVIHSTQWASNYVTATNTTTLKELQITNNGGNYNNNITEAFEQQHQQQQKQKQQQQEQQQLSVYPPSYSTSSDCLSESSPDDSIGDFEEAAQSSSSTDVSPQGDEYRCFGHEEPSDSDSQSEDGNCRRGIVNPNYPGFQHLAHTLRRQQPTDSDDDEDEDGVDEEDSCSNNNNNNGAEACNGNNNNSDLEDDCAGENKIDSINHLDSIENFQKAFYDKPKFNIPLDPDPPAATCCCNESPTVASVQEKDLNVSFGETGAFGHSPDTCSSASCDSTSCSNNRSSCSSCGEEAEARAPSPPPPPSAPVTLELARPTPPPPLPPPARDPRYDVDKCQLVTGMAAVALDTQAIAATKMTDAFLSGAKEELLATAARASAAAAAAAASVAVTTPPPAPAPTQPPVPPTDSNRAAEEREKFRRDEQAPEGTKDKDMEDPVVPRKKEKMEINYCVKKSTAVAAAAAAAAAAKATAAPVSGGGVVRRREFAPRRDPTTLSNRRSLPAAREKKRASPEILGGFDVYNIETAMPKIDLDAIESHLRAAREEERRRRNDREEIRRRLAMGSDADEYYGGERPGRKPSLQARLQSGMNLQICFMNETVSDPESPSSDTESSSSPAKANPEKMSVPHSHSVPFKQPPPAAPVPAATRPSTSLLSLPLRREPDPAPPMTEADFFARQAQLQAEARLALAQAKEMAHMQMEVERQRQKKSPITEMVRSSLEKVGIPFPEDRRRVSRQLLTEMNVAQLQVIVNDLHTQIEVLNEGLVKFLMDRDDLHMEQDSMLVDIEDLTRYLGAKEQTVKEHKDVKLINQNNNLLTSGKPKINRIASLVKK